MKKGVVLIAVLLIAVCAGAAEKLTLKAITGGEFSPERVYGVNPIEGTDQYASITADGKRTGEPGTLEEGVPSDSGYVVSDKQ